MRRICIELVRDPDQLRCKLDAIFASRLHQICCVSIRCKLDAVFASFLRRVTVKIRSNFDAILRRIGIEVASKLHRILATSRCKYDANIRCQFDAKLHRTLTTSRCKYDANIASSLHRILTLCVRVRIGMIRRENAAMPTSLES